MLYIKTGHTIDNKPRFGWDNKILTVTASGTDTNSNANNVLNGSTSERWLATDNTTSSYTFDFTVPVTGIEYIGMCGHNLNANNLAEIAIKTSSDGVTYTDVFTAFSPTSDDSTPLIFYFPSNSNAYWRIVIESTDVIAGEFLEAPFISNLYAGNFLEMPRNIYVNHTPINYSANTNVFAKSSESGEFLGKKVLSRSLESQFDFNFIDRAWWKSTFYPFVKSAEENPFFVIWRGDDFPEEVAFCQTTRDISVNQPHAKGQIDISMRVAAHHSGWL